MQRTINPRGTQTLLSRAVTETLENHSPSPEISEEPSILGMQAKCFAGREMAGGKNFLFFPAQDQRRWARRTPGGDLSLEKHGTRIGRRVDDPPYGDLSILRK